MAFYVVGAKGLKGDWHLPTYREENQFRKISRRGRKKENNNDEANDGTGSTWRRKQNQRWSAFCRNIKK